MIERSKGSRISSVQKIQTVTSSAQRKEGVSRTALILHTSSLYNLTLLRAVKSVELMCLIPDLNLEIFQSIVPCP